MESSSKLAVFLELRSRKTFRFLEQIMSTDKYPSIFSRQMETIVYLSWIVSQWFLCFDRLQMKYNSQILACKQKQIKCSFRSNQHSCAKEQQSRCLLHADWMHFLAKSNQCGATAWLRMSFQNVTNGRNAKSQYLSFNFYRSSLPGYRHVLSRSSIQKQTTDWRIVETTEAE